MPAFLLFCLLVAPLKAMAVQDLPPDWPATPANVDTNGFALILGGGGARGIAHIGVIEMLEELGMRPDLIVGTSMGSVVGALYAAGKSAAEIKEIALGQSIFDMIVKTETPPAQLQGGWWDPAPHQLSLQVDRWPPLPNAGLSRGQGFESMIGENTSDALFLGGNDFDNLPIPFRCTSTDLLQNSLVIHDHGSLPRAVKASSTIPMIFYPVPDGERQLVDGGFLDNLPVQVARRLGFDRAVLVDVSNVHLPDKEVPKDLYEMWVRMAELQTLFPNDYSVGPEDVLLKMPLSDYRSMSMSAAAEILAIGQETASQHREELKALRDACGPAVFRNQGEEAVGPVTLQSIEVRGLERMQPERVLERLQMHEGGQMELAQAWRQAEWLCQEGSFQTISFEFQRLGSDSAQAVVHVEEDTHPSLELGASVITDDGAAIMARLRANNLFGRGGTHLLSYRYSDREARLDALVDQSINDGGWLALRAFLRWQRELPVVYSAGLEVDRYVFQRTQLSLDLAVRSFSFGWSLYLGGDFGQTSSYRESRPMGDDGSQDLRTLHVALESHSRNLPVLRHRRGAKIRYTRSLETDEEFSPWWRTDLGWVLPVDGLGSWNPVWAVGAVFSSTHIPVIHQGRAGGPQGWVGLRRDEIIAPQVAWSQVALQRMLGAGVYVELATAVGWFGQEDLSVAKPLWGGALEVGMDSLLGPLKLGYALAQQRQGYVYLQAGHAF